MNFPHKQLNGVLRHFYNRHKETYFSYVNASASSFYQGPRHREPQQILDFDSNSWWFCDSQNKSNEFPYITFCLTRHRLQMSGYEIKTSPSLSLPTKWAMTLSNNVLDFKKESNNANYIETAYNMSSGEIKYVEFSSNNAYQCFQIQNLANNPNGGKCIDIMQVELFGKLISIERLPKCTKYYSKVLSAQSQMLVIILSIR